GSGQTAPFGTVPRTLHLPTYGAVVYNSLPLMRLAGDFRQRRFGPVARGLECSCAASLNFVSWIGSARASLCRGLGSRWFTERFHRNALVTHFQHGQVFCTARQLKDYAVTRCRLHQRAPQRDARCPWLVVVFELLPVSSRRI